MPVTTAGRLVKRVIIREVCHYRHAATSNKKPADAGGFFAMLGRLFLFVGSSGIFRSHLTGGNACRSNREIFLAMLNDRYTLRQCNA